VALRRASAGPAAAARIGATRTAQHGVSDRNDNTTRTALLLDDGDDRDGPTARLGRRDGATARRRYGATRMERLGRHESDGATWTARLRLGRSDSDGAATRMMRLGRRYSDGATRTAQLGWHYSYDETRTVTVRLGQCNSDGTTRTARLRRRDSDGATARQRNGVTMTQRRAVDGVTAKLKRRDA
jgi:hypothetical protein